MNATIIVTGLLGGQVDEPCTISENGNVTYVSDIKGMCDAAIEYATIDTSTGSFCLGGSYERGYYIHPNDMRKFKDLKEPGIDVGNSYETTELFE